MNRRNTLTFLAATAWLPLLLTTAVPSLTGYSASQSSVVLPAPEQPAPQTEETPRVPAAEPATELAAVMVAADGIERGSLTMSGHAGRLSPAMDDAGLHDLPYVALLAYQRAARVLTKADPDCGLRWPVLAAIGRVESDHGRYAASSPGRDGVSRPLIVGPALDGAGPVARIADTDGGQWDGDARWDRAVGPMQIIPSTWSMVGVDGDADGVRSPHDVDDASLAAAVYLCAGPDSLTSPHALAAAVGRYNHSASYVALVLTYVDQYASGRFALELDHPAFASVPLDLRAAPIPQSRRDRPAKAPTSTKDVTDKPGSKPEGPQDATAHARPGRPPGGSAAPAAQDRPDAASPALGVPEDTDDQSTEPPSEQQPVDEPIAAQPAATPAAAPAPAATSAPTSAPVPTATASADAEPATSAPDPEPGPDPEPLPETAAGTTPVSPSPVTLTGVWTSCDEGWCVDGQPVRLPEGATADQPARTDLDGVVGTLAEELAGREDTIVTVEVQQGPDGWSLVLP